MIERDLPPPETDLPAVHDPAGMGMDSAVEPAEPEELTGEAGAVDVHGLDTADKAALLTALLFTAGERIDNARLQEYLGVDAAALRQLASQAAEGLRLSGLDIATAADGLKLVSALRWDAELSAYHRQVRKARLSRSALEILAIIAYEQPTSRTRIDELRQVNSESSVRSLLDRRLVKVAGRSDSPGRPFLYATTSHFLEVFGLESLADLPPRPQELKAAAGQPEFGEPDEPESKPVESGAGDLLDFTDE